MSDTIFPPHLVVKAMRDSGFKNAAYALAELIDNAVDAKATNIELLCGESSGHQGWRKKIEQIAVIDNGIGMDNETLLNALEFGNGINLNKKNNKTIGKFGFGLPNSSISQCKRLEVWSWKDGPSSSIYSYIDVDEISSGEMVKVPEPIKKEIPKTWKTISKNINNTGTLVIWKNFDKITWKTASTIIRHSENLIGRIYRYQLNEKMTIRMVGFNLDNNAIDEEKNAIANDPMYLMKKTSCPSPWNDKAMFREYGVPDIVKIEYEGEKYEVKIKYSYFRDEAREKDNSGAAPHGKHAGRNVGVSVVRSGREITLDSSWANSYDPRERWWSVEIDYPAALDEIFGLTNDKQHVRNFTEVSQFEPSKYKNDDQSFVSFSDDLKDENDPNYILFKIAIKIQKNIKVMRGLIKASSKGKRSKRVHIKDKNSPENKATEATIERQTLGIIGESDKGESNSVQTRKEEIKKYLEGQGLNKNEIETLSATVTEDGLKYVFTDADLETPAFFSVKPRGGALIITLNNNHPAYKNLIEVIDHDIAEDESSEELKDRLLRAKDGMKLLLFAWARYEDETPDGVEKDKIADSRLDWGRVAKKFLSTN
jgi:hypothetical protein